MVVEKITEYCKEISLGKKGFKVEPQLNGDRLVNVIVQFDPRCYDLTGMSFLDRLRGVKDASKMALTDSGNINLVESGTVLLFVNDQVAHFDANLVKKGIGHVVDYLNEHRRGAQEG